MFSPKYHINPETLRFERIRLPRRQRNRLCSLVGIGVVLLAVGIRVGFERHFPTPRLISYEEENLQLRTDYSALNSTLQVLEVDLASVANKDDRFYRSILSLEPVPSSIREAGTGGAVRHSELGNIREPGMVLSVEQRMEKLSSRMLIQSSSLENVYKEAVTTKQFMACRPSIRPISPADPCWLTSSYGFRNDPFTHRRTAHHGIDLAGPYGLSIYASGAGKVITAKQNRYGYGNEVIVDHGFGYTSIYAHLQDILVEKGQEIKRGEVVGTMGSTGRSTGPHLHYEIRKDGHPVNPFMHFSDNLSAGEYTLMAQNANQQNSIFHGEAFSQK